MGTSIRRRRCSGVPARPAIDRVSEIHDLIISQELARTAMRCHKTNASAPAIQMQRTTIMLHKVMIGIAVVVVRCFMPVTSSSRRRTPASRASLPPPKRKATDQQAGASIQRLHLVDLQELSRKRLVIAKAEWTQGEAFAPRTAARNVTSICSRTASRPTMATDQLSL